MFSEIAVILYAGSVGRRGRQNLTPTWKIVTLVVNPSKSAAEVVILCLKVGFRHQKFHKLNPDVHLIIITRLMTHVKVIHRVKNRKCGRSRISEGKLGCKVQSLPIVWKLQDKRGLRLCLVTTILSFYIWGVHWRHLANTTKPSVCCDDAALCQITLTTCYYYFLLLLPSGLFLPSGLVYKTVLLFKY